MCLHGLSKVIYAIMQSLINLNKGARINDIGFNVYRVENRLFR